MEKSLPKNPEICPNCYVGRISQQPKSLVMMHEGEPLTFPGFPAWACDVCNAFVYDPTALMQLETLLRSNKAATLEFPVPKSAVKHRKLNKPNKTKPVDQK